MGPLLVADDEGRQIRVAAARQRVLMAALLVRANRTVPVAELAELVWDGVPPPGAARTVRSYMVRLRRSLHPQVAARIETVDPGYLCRVAEQELDLLRFEALCRDAGEAVRSGRWNDAAETTAGALELWRDAPLQDVPSQALRDECANRLEQLRVQALEDQAEAQLRLGRHERQVPQLRELTGAYPLRERFHAQLMAALVGCGRRAEALEAYQSARRTLVDELGVEPGAELRELHQQILEGTDVQPAATPSIAQPPAPAPAAKATVAPRQLPAAAGHFTGRRGELDLLVEFAEKPDQNDGASGTVVISAIDGMAGIGKTALAVHAGHRVADRFPDGQLFIDLHGYTQGHPPREPAQALDWLLRSLGIPAQHIPEDAEARAALYRQRLADTRTLIVLDNAADEAQVRPLMPANAGCLVIVTSRRRLKGLDAACTLSLDLLPALDAIALLRAIAGPDRFPADDRLLDEIAGLCGYLPLALRIAAALLRHRPAWDLEHLAGLLREQHQRLRTLSDGEHDLAAVFDLSYTSLSAQHQQLWRRLGLVPGPDLDTYAAAALADVDPPTATALLERLVDHNLLISHTAGRYHLHDLMRTHARTLIATDPAPQREAAQDRLLHYYAHTAQRASIPIARFPRAVPAGPSPTHGPELSDPDAARSWLRTEYPNLEAAYAHANAHDLHKHAIAVAAGLAEILRADGPYAHALELHQTAADIAERIGRPAACAAALTDLGRLRYIIGDLTGADAAHDRALEVFREIGDRTGEAATLTDLGRVRCLTGNCPESEDALTRALHIFRETGNRQGEANALYQLGRLWHLVGDYAEAHAAHARALEIFREIGDRTGEAVTLTDLGCLWQVTEDFSEAEAALTRALHIVREIGHSQYEAGALGILGRVRHLTGDYPAAEDALARALQIFREIGARGDEAWALNHYAAAIAANGDVPRAYALYQQALAMNRELNKPDDEAIGLEGLADCHLARGDTEAATTHLKQALDIYQRLGMAHDTDRTQHRLDGVAPQGNS